MISSLPLFLLAIVSGYVYLAARWNAKRRRSNKLEWRALANDVRSNAEIEELVPNFRWTETHKFEQDRLWERVGLRGLWDIYHNAGVYLRMVDFAVASGTQLSEKIIEELQSDVLQLRLCVLLAIAQWMFSRSVASSVNCGKAVVLYCGLAQRLTATFQECRPDLFPSLMEAL
jgi:hypothetical protein